MGFKITYIGRTHAGNFRFLAFLGHFTVGHAFERNAHNPRDGAFDAGKRLGGFYAVTLLDFTQRGIDKTAVEKVGFTELDRFKITTATA